MLNLVVIAKVSNNVRTVSFKNNFIVNVLRVLANFKDTFKLLDILFYFTNLFPHNDASA